MHDVQINAACGDFAVRLILLLFRLVDTLMLHQTIICLPHMQIMAHQSGYDPEFPLAELIDSALGDDPLNPDALSAFRESLVRTLQLLEAEQRETEEQNEDRVAARA